MNRPRERAIIGGICQQHGVTRETCTHYAMLLEALLTDGVDEIIRGRMEDGPKSGPFVSAMRRAGARPMPSVWAAIDRQAAAEGVTPAQVFEAAEAWLINGNRADDARGVLDWAKSGKRSNREGRATERQPEPVVRRYLPDDPASL